MNNWQDHFFIYSNDIINSTSFISYIQLANDTSLSYSYDDQNISMVNVGKDLAPLSIRFIEKKYN